MTILGIISAIFIRYCDYHLVTRILDITTIFPDSQSQFQHRGLIALRLLVSVFIGYCDYFALVPR